MEHQGQACGPIRDLLSRIGDKWSVLTIVQLGDGPKRFGELLRGGHGVSQRMLTLTLRNLERDGLVWRKVTPTVPLTVEYGVTPLGADLFAVLQPFFAWCLANNGAVATARATYDAQLLQAGEGDRGAVQSAP